LELHGAKIMRKDLVILASTNPAITACMADISLY